MTDPKAMIVQLTVGELEAMLERAVSKVANKPGAAERDLDPVMSAEEAAKFLKMPVNILRKKAREGAIESFKIGALVRFRLSQLNTFLAAQPSARKKAV